MAYSANAVKCIAAHRNGTGDVDSADLVRACIKQQERAAIPRCKGGYIPYSTNTEVFRTGACTLFSFCAGTLCCLRQVYDLDRLCVYIQYKESVRTDTHADCFGAHGTHGYAIRTLTNRLGDVDIFDLAFECQY